MTRGRRSEIKVRQKKVHIQSEAGFEYLTGRENVGEVVEGL
jgi:hypothetical protein